MAAKRNASSDLNADNWNQDDEPEDPGTFKKASDETLSKRVIKTAKRRYANTDVSILKFKLILIANRSFIQPVCNNN